MIRLFWLGVSVGGSWGKKKNETCENEDAEHSKNLRTDSFDTEQDKNTLNQSQMKN